MKIVCHITPKFAWWVDPYIYACFLFGFLFNASPDVEKMTNFCLKGAKPVFRFEHIDDGKEETTFESIYE